GHPATEAQSGVGAKREPIRIAPVMHSFAGEGAWCSPATCFSCYRVGRVVDMSSSLRLEAALRTAERSSQRRCARTDHLRSDPAGLLRPGQSHYPDPSTLSR